MVVARQAGVSRIELGIIADHVELQRWYEKLGFSAVRTLKPPHLPFNVTLMGHGEAKLTRLHDQAVAGHNSAPH
jgi:hypothetical protein